MLGLPQVGTLKMSKPFKKRNLTARSLMQKGMTHALLQGKVTNLMKNAHLPGDVKGTGKLV